MIEKLIKEIADHYGNTHQIPKLAEEAAELSAAAIRYLLDDTKETRGDLESEIADVLIMITQVIYLTESEDRVSKKVEFKVARQLERMGVKTE